MSKGLYSGGPFQQMMMEIRPYLVVFAIAGVFLMLGLWILLFNAFRLLWSILRKPVDHAAGPVAAEQATARAG